MEQQNKNPRREFFKHAALTGVSLAVSPALSFAGSQEERLQTNASNLTTRKLGSLEVSAIGLGCMNMVAGTYNPNPDKKRNDCSPAESC